MYSAIFFDLDGTLTDPGEGITNSVAYALQRFGIVESDRTKLFPFIGPPLIDSFERFYHFSPEQARQAVIYYREYYRQKGIFENKVYDGIPQLLNALRQADIPLILATAKPEPFARQILEHYGLAAYFTVIAGSTLDETRTRKDEVLRYALQQCPPHFAQKAVMVGDREHDVLGAAAVSMPCIGVLFGYGSEQELRKAGAVRLAATVQQLHQILLEA